MSDLIERQAAIDCVSYDVQDTIERIEALPSAQPEPDTGLYLAGFDDGYKQAQQDAQPDQSIKEKSVDIGYLHDWYQNSVTDDPPVWTDEHIKEMFCDFYMIPRQEKEREEIMNEFDRTSGGD